MTTRLAFMAILLFGLFGCSSFKNQFRGDGNRTPAYEFIPLKDVAKITLDKYSKQIAATSRAGGGPMGGDADYPFSLGCTLVFVGKNGEALTAQHCIEQYLRRYVEEKTQYALVSFEGGQRHTFFAVDSEVLKLGDSYKGGSVIRFLNALEIDKTKLPITVMNDYGPDGKPVPLFELLWSAGPGWIEDRELLGELDVKDYIEVHNKGFNSWGDMVLVRLKKKNTACVKLDKPSSNSWKRVFSISYPAMTRSYCPNGNCPAHIPMFTSGQLSNDLSYVAQKTNSSADNIFFKKTMISGTSRADIDAEMCSSGAPVFESDSGALTGIVAYVFRTSRKLDTGPESWATQVIDIAPFVDEIKKLVPTNDSCE